MTVLTTCYLPAHGRYRYTIDCASDDAGNECNGARMSNGMDGTLLVPLRTLFDKGVRYSTVIDIGCADGTFFLYASATGLLPGAVPLNIDASSVYEESLKAIKEAVGGQYRIAAISDREGQLELTTSVHPYWSSLRPSHDQYWKRLNDLSVARISVPATTLDSLVRQLGMQPPYLLKLDVQGAEEQVLRGAHEVLRGTHAVICEADVEDFQISNSALVGEGFRLYDLTNLNRIADGTLGWFYATYTNQSLDFVRPVGFWDAKENERVIRLQVERRQAMLKMNADILARIRGQRGS